MLLPDERETWRSPDRRNETGSLVAATGIIAIFTIFGIAGWTTDEAPGLSANAYAAAPHESAQSYDVAQSPETTATLPLLQHVSLYK